MTITPKKAFSAPGKALLAGGYLVLDPKYKAYTVALSARIHTVVETVPRINSSTPFSIKFQSPQFLDSTWKYDTSNNICLQPCKENKSLNPFLYWASLVALSYVLIDLEEDLLIDVFSRDLDITIYSDDSFHTQTAENSLGERKQIGASGKSFYFHYLPISQVPKTGMGSSAALTVSVITALLSALLPNFNLNSTGNLNTNGSDDEDNLIKVHNLSQIAHCLAQKKIGSGFDVASAVWGSVVYSRFPPSKFDKLFKLTQDPRSFVEENYATFCHEVHEVADTLKVVHEKCSLPSNYTLLMGDVNGGSETPKLVSKVLEWRKANPERALQVWTALDQYNMQLIQQLHTSPSTTSTTTESDLHDTIQGIRQNLRTMSQEAHVPIEPESQTILLDKCQSLPGVIGAVVPGAGGYDAICVLVDKAQVSNITRLSSQDEILKQVTWLDIHEEFVGVTSEKVSDYV